MRTDKRVTAIIFKEDSVLLIHRFKFGKEYWVLPGGGVESEETVLEALHREVMEETSLPVLKEQFLLEKYDPSINVTHLFFICRVGEGTPKISGPELLEASEDNIYKLEWVDINLIPSLTVYPEHLKTLDLKSLSMT